MNKDTRKRKLVLVSIWYAGKCYSKFVHTIIDTNGKAVISDKAYTDFIAECGLTHKCIGRY